MLKKLALHAIVLILVSALLVACAQSGGNSAPMASGESTAASVAPSQAEQGDESARGEHMEITVSQWDNGNWERTPEDIWLKNLGEKFNVTFKSVVITWEDWQDKTRLWAASGELPDLFVHDENYTDWVNQGLFKAIPLSMLDQYSNIKNTINPSVLDALTVDGNIYSIPKSHFTDISQAEALDAIYVRKDFLEKAGLDAPPDTLDGWYDFLKKAVDEDFSGTGRTIGLRDVKLLTAMPFIKTNDQWINEDGRWIPTAFSKNHIQEIEFARKLFKDGIMSEDFSIMKIFDERTLFQQGRMAIMQANGDPGLLHQQITPDMGQVTVDDFITLSLPPKADDGKRYFNYTLNFGFYSAVSPKASDEKLERIMQIMDYLSGDEGQIYSIYGVEDVDYESIDGSPITSPLQNDNIRSLLPVNQETGQQSAIWDKYPSAWFGNCFPSWNTWANFINPIYAQEERDLATDYFARVQADTVKPTPNLDILFLSTPEKNRMPNLDSLYNELYVQLVMSDADIETSFNKWVDEQMSKYQKAIDEVNENVG